MLACRRQMQLGANNVRFCRCVLNTAAMTRLGGASVEMLRRARAPSSIRTVASRSIKRQVIRSCSVIRMRMVVGGYGWVRAVDWLSRRLFARRAERSNCATPLWHTTISRHTLMPVLADNYVRTGQRAFRQARAILVRRVSVS